MNTTESVARRLDQELDRLLQAEAPKPVQRRVATSGLCLCWFDAE